MSVLVRKPPKLARVKFVRKRLTTGAAWFAYYNTGQNDDGKAIYAALPKWGTVGFYDSLASFEAGRTKRQAPAFSVAVMAHQFSQSPEFARLAENTRKLYASQLLKIVDLVGDFPPDSVEPSDMRLAMGAQGWNAGTYNTVLAVVGVLFRWGRRHDKTKADPVRDIERLKGGSHQPWPQDVLEAALGSDNPTIRLAVHLLYFTGQRIGDVCKMRWGDIRKGKIFVRQTKTGKVVEPPLMSELKAELDRTDRTGIFILDGIDERRLRRDMCAFTQALGVKTVPHGLRKNAVNALLEAGCSVPEVAAITGQTHQVVEHYAAKVNTRKLGDAAIVKFEQARRK